MRTTHRFEVRLTEELFERLAQLAALNNRSLNRELNHAAEVWTAQLRSPALREALAGVERAAATPDSSVSLHVVHEWAGPATQSPQRFAEAAVTYATALEHLRDPNVQSAIEILSRPELGETLQRVQQVGRELPLIFGGSFARDWDSERDSAYDGLQ